jgi:hypothetical protein
MPEGDRSYFVTNMHNLDPRLKLGDETSYKMRRVEIELRRATGDHFHAETRFFTVANHREALLSHRTADVAALVNPEFVESTIGFRWATFDKSLIASGDFLANSVVPMDVASFIGFPARKERPWYDELWHTPIARTVNIASWPKVPFKNAGIKTTDVTLVSGLSFGGSSGSPILLHEKGIEFKNVNDATINITGGNHVPPMIIGIMSGHWWGEEDLPTSMFYHSGLSYFTRSTAIHELLRSA